MKGMRECALRFILHPSAFIFRNGAHPQQKLHQREGWSFLAALTGLEVCEPILATSVPNVFGDIPQVRRLAGVRYRANDAKQSNDQRER